MCSERGCEKPEDRDGVCFRHRMASIRVNGLHVLRNEREVNMTQGEMAQEIFDDAKRTGTDIAQVRGRRTATQVYKNGEWV